MESPNTKQWFAAQGLSIADADEVFTLLDADRSDTTLGWFGTLFPLFY